MNQVRKERRTGWSSGGDNVRDRNRVILRGREALERRLTEYFEKLMKVENKEEAILTCLGMNANSKRAYEQYGMNREVERVNK